MTKCKNTDKGRKILGISLICGGVLVLALFFTFSFETLEKILTTVGISKETVQEEMAEIQNIRPYIVPDAKGVTALDSFYSAHPKTNKEEEYYLDSSLWALPQTQIPQDTKATPSLQDTILLGKKNKATPLGLWSGSSAEMVDTSIKPAQNKLQKQKVYTTEKKQQDTLQDTLQGNSPLKVHVHFVKPIFSHKEYRLEGDNLYLYGIDTIENIIFQRDSEGLLMYYKKSIFLLKPCSEQTPFVEYNASQE